MSSSNGGHEQNNKEYLRQLYFELHGSANQLLAFYPIFYFAYFIIHFHKTSHKLVNPAIFCSFIAIPISIWLLVLIIAIVRKHFNRFVLTTVFLSIVSYQLLTLVFIVNSSHFEDWLILLILSQVPAMFLLSRTNVRMFIFSFFIASAITIYAPIPFAVQLLAICIYLKVISINYNTLKRTQVTLINRRKSLTIREKRQHVQQLRSEILPLVNDCLDILDSDLTEAELLEIEPKCHKLSEKIKLSDKI